MEIGGPYTLSDLKVAKPEIWVLGSNGAKPGLRDWIIGSGRELELRRWYAMSLGKRSVLDFAKRVGWQAGGAQAYARATIAGHYEETPQADH
jgi:hypothetical protein